MYFSPIFSILHRVQQTVQLSARTVILSTLNKGLHWHHLPSKTRPLTWQNNLFCWTPQLLPGRRIYSCPLLCVCVHGVFTSHYCVCVYLHKLNADQFRVWVWFYHKIQHIDIIATKSHVSVLKVHLFLSIALTNL